MRLVSLILSAMQGLNAPVVIMGLNYEATDRDVISVDGRCLTGRL